MDQNGNEKRPILKSAEELKGRKAPKDNKKKANKWIIVLICAVLIGGVAGVYYGTDLFTPDEVIDESGEVAAENIRSQLIEREKQDFDRVSINVRDGEAFTIVNNIQYDAEGNAIDANAAPEPAATDDAGAPTATDSPEPTEAAGEVDPTGATAPVGPAEEETGEDPATEPEVLPNYTVEGMPYFKLNETAVSSIVTYATNLASQHTVEENAQDMAMYGLETPSVTVNFYYRDGTSETIFIGDQVPTGSYRYASKAGDNNVYMVLNGVYTAFTKTLNSMHVVEMPITMTMDTIASIIVEQRGQETVELQYLNELSDDAISMSILKLRQPIEYDAHSTRAAEVLEAATVVAINGYAGHAQTEEELATYGLAEPRAVISMTDREGNQLSFRIGNVTGADSYAQIDETGDVYTVSNASIEFVQNMRVGYLADQFTNIINIQKVDTLTVEGGGETYVLHIENETTVGDDGEEKVVSSYFFDGEPTEETPFKKIYQEIIGTILDNVSADYHHDGEVVAKVTYKLNTGAEDFVVEYLDYDKDYYAVRRDGLTLFLIKHEKIAQMLSSCQAYRDGTFTY